MKFKSFNLLVFSFIALSLGFFTKTAAAVEYFTTVDDSLTRTNLEHYCGTSENTSDSCREEYNDCYQQFNAIDNHMYDVCGDLNDRSECYFDVSSITMKTEMYRGLYAVPVADFRNNPSINKIDLCRAENPKNAKPKTQADIDEEMRRREIELELGMAEAPVVAAEAAPDNAAAQKVDVPAAPQNADAENAGGCSLQFVKSPSNALHTVIAFLLVILPFTMSSSSGDRSKRK